MRFLSFILIATTIGVAVAHRVQHHLHHLHNHHHKHKPNYRDHLLEKDADYVAANFPEVDAELLSPAFLYPEAVPKEFADGTSGPTPQIVLDRWLQSLAENNDWMTYQESGFTSEEGRSIPYVVLSTSSSVESLTGDAHNNSTKLRIWVTGGVHGNEPASDQAVLALLGKLDANRRWTESLLEKADLLVLPRYNPDGVAGFQRNLATNSDPNRDHTKLAEKQTRDIKILESRFAPHISIDCHEYYAHRRHGRYGEYLPAQDAQISAMKNLNIHPSIRHLSETLFVSRMGAAMDTRGLRWGPYVTRPNATELLLLETGTDAKMDTHAALSQGVQILTETRGIRLADQHFRRRVATGLLLLETAMQTVMDHGGQIYATIEAARADFIASKEDIVVTDYHRITDSHWPFIDSSTGEIVDLPIQFGNSTPVAANLTRARPEAYIFDASRSDVAEKLRVAGVQVETLTHPFQGDVEAIHISEYTVDSPPPPYAGGGAAAAAAGGAAKTIITKSQVVKKHLDIPAGGFWVSTRQRMAAHAFVRLEPENKDSFAAFGIVPLVDGEDHPIYRVMA